MPARTKGRAKFDFRGRPFLWWVDRDFYLRICSADKRFVIAFALGTLLDEPLKVGVIGPEFLGVDRSERRPVWLVAPTSTMEAGDMGTWVGRLLTWAFDPTHTLVRTDRPRFAGTPDDPGTMAEVASRS